MIPDRRQFSVQLQDGGNGENIITAGGRVIVTAAGSPRKLALLDRTGATLTNPFTPTRGKIEFLTDVDVLHVDMFILSPNGEFLVVRNVWASGPNEVFTISPVKHNVMVLPFSFADLSGAGEQNSGMMLPARCVTLPGSFLDVRAADAGITANVGTLSTEAGGDADAMIAAGSLANVGVVVGAALAAPTAQGGRTISYSLSGAPDTGEGYIHIPYVLAA